MDYRRLGGSGLLVSRISLGMMSFGSSAWQPWVLDRKQAGAFVTRALDLGINCFDTADFYSLGASEEALGQALANSTARSKVVVATKVGLPMDATPNGGGLSRKHIVESVDASLRRLQTDYIDLLQLHRFDPHTPLEETLDALETVTRAGKVLYVGASNFTAAQLAPAVFAHRWSSVPRLSSMQLQYNLVYRETERDLLPLCVGEGIGVIVYSPLARGALANARRSIAPTARESLREQTDLKGRQLYGGVGDDEVTRALAEVADRHGVPSARIAFAWLLSRDEVDTVLCGALEPSHIEEAVAALDIEMTSEEIAMLESAYTPRAVKDDAFGAVVASGRGLPA